MSASPAQPAPRIERHPEPAVQLETPWLVVVLNDSVNLMSYVVLVFKRVFGFADGQARTHMLEVHERGRSVVWQGDREKAEAYVHSLQSWQLTAVLEHGRTPRD